jgi:hypothetical protein
MCLCISSLKKNCSFLAHSDDPLHGELQCLNVQGIRSPAFYWLTLHGDTVAHFFNSSVAQRVDLSAWQEVQGFGIPDLSVSAGVMNRNVCALTKLSLIVCSILGMWQATH